MTRETPCGGNIHNLCTFSKDEIGTVSNSMKIDMLLLIVKKNKLENCKSAYVIHIYIQYCAECKGASDQISTSFCESRTA